MKQLQAALAIEGSESEGIVGLGNVNGPSTIQCSRTPVIAAFGSRASQGRKLVGGSGG